MSGAFTFQMFEDMQDTPPVPKPHVAFKTAPKVMYFIDADDFLTKRYDQYGHWMHQQLFSMRDVRESEERTRKERESPTSIS